MIGRFLKHLHLLIEIFWCKYHIGDSSLLIVYVHVLLNLFFLFALKNYAFLKLTFLHMQADRKWIFGSEKWHIGSISNIAFKTWLPNMHGLQGNNWMLDAASYVLKEQVLHILRLRNQILCLWHWIYFPCLSNWLILRWLSHNIMALCCLYNVCINGCCLIWTGC